MRILYFAELREIIGKSEDLIDISKPETITKIILKLKSKNKSYKLAFNKTKNLKCAVNCEYVNSFNIKVKNNDEIAFFPPVTGG